MEITIQGLNVKIKRKEILHELNMHIDNHIYGLMGPNGAGKTTLIRSILDLIPINQGKITFSDNTQLIKFNDIKVGYLPQKFEGFKELTIYEMLDYICELKQVPKDRRLDEIQNALEKVNLQTSIKVKCGQLSGGMMRRLGIAQALLGNPDILIFDEPTVGLDPDERLRFKLLLKNYERQIPIILSTHIVDDIANSCTHALFMKDGTIIKEGSINELIQLYKNHIYETNLDQIKKEDIIIREVDKNIVRVYSSELIDNNLNPTVDDLYQLIIHHEL